MKPTNFFIFWIFLFLFSCSTKHENNTPTPPPVIDFEKEKAAIMEAVAAESAAFWNKDFEKYASYWVHEPYLRTMGWWPAGGVNVVEGWEARGKRTKSHFEKSPDPNPNATKVRRENINIRIYQDVAWLTYDQYGVDSGDELMDMPGLSRETRFMEKHDGQWKIAYACWLLEGDNK